MDIRVGKIIEVWNHPEREKLYCERVDIGNGEIRNVVSGLRELVPIEKMQNAMCIVLANLKARNMGGFESHGMVLCGESADGKVVDILAPPEGSVPGDLVEFEGQGRKPPAVLGKKGTEDPKKDPWGNVQPKLSVGSDGTALWKDIPFTVPGKGAIKAPTLKAGIIK